MRWVFRLFLVLLLTPRLLPAWEAESTEPIKIVVNDWSSQIVLSRVLGNLYASMGYKVEYPFYTTDKQFGAMNLGWAHVQVEVWEGTMAKDFERVERKNVVRAGTHRAKTREEWWYPAYVEAMCPGLPDWRALKKCGAIFATEKSGGKGVYHGGPWEKPDALMTRALGLDFIIETAKDSDELTAILEAAYKKKEPVLLFNWTPNWTELVYEGAFVEFPPYDPACETDPAWGVNDFYTHDCGNPKDGALFKGAWKGMSTKWPCAYAILERMDLDNRMIAEAAYLVDYKKLDYETAARRWAKKYEEAMKQWIPDRCGE